MRIFKHSKDWCHLCGKRSELLFDIFYRPSHSSTDSYFRICQECVSELKTKTDKIKFREV